MVNKKAILIRALALKRTEEANLSKIHNGIYEYCECNVKLRELHTKKTWRTHTKKGVKICLHLCESDYSVSLYADMAEVYIPCNFRLSVYFMV